MGALTGTLMRFLYGPRLLQFLSWGFSTVSVANCSPHMALKNLRP